MPVNWVSTDDNMPIPYRSVLVPGGCAYWDGTYWYTYMERNHPKIQWTVKHWAPMPELPTEYWHKKLGDLRKELEELKSKLALYEATPGLN